jgi:hypothetical protein
MTDRDIAQITFRRPRWCAVALFFCVLDICIVDANGQHEYMDQKPLKCVLGN